MTSAEERVHAKGASAEVDAAVEGVGGVEKIASDRTDVVQPARYDRNKVAGLILIETFSNTIYLETIVKRSYEYGKRETAIVRGLGIVCSEVGLFTCRAVRFDEL